MPEGDKTRPSIRELAKQAGVSIATASRAMNDVKGVSKETRQRILSAARELGYAPRPPMPGREIGVVYRGRPIPASYGSFESAMLLGIMEVAAARDFDVKIIGGVNSLDGDESYQSFFRRKGVRGVIVRAVEPEPTLAEAIANDDCTAVMIANRSEQSNVNFVCGDSRGASREAITHLLRLGHKRIAICIHGIYDSDHRDRLQGYLEALAEAGIAPDPDLQLRADVPGSSELGTLAMERFLGMDSPPTAVFFTDPLSTIGALHRCVELGVHVPGDLSIVGTDDSNVRRHSMPKYSAVCQDATALGRRAMEWLAGTLDGEVSSPLRERMPIYFDVLDSTGVVPSTR